ncbi:MULTISPECIES: PE-PPE domain-containing protein [unclassified Mycobacterium]|uniref:PE-PPE domain-containing protein n=1 Tax=unclassified Mycobacterium TaxID=2642494 RepID=UPI0029C87A2A|nr:MULTISPECIES: PE-PPE domain-containing protein [unclassified Mycobacterium]
MGGNSCSGKRAVHVVGGLATAATASVVAVTVIAATAHATTTFYVPGTAQTPQKSGPVDLSSLDPGLTRFATEAQQIGYPASFAPFAGTIALDKSVAQGVSALDAAIRAVPAGEPIQLVGVSQGDVVLSVELRALMANLPANTDITVVRVADPTSPTGIMGRNAGLRLPGLTFVSAPETPFDTVYITRQYDGIADWPARQLNVLADVNAVLGAFYLHDQPNYAGDLASLPAGNVTTTTNSLGATTTTYLIPNTGLLPILRPFQDLGVDERLLDAVQVPLQRVIDSAYTAAGQKALQAVVNTASRVASVTGAAIHRVAPRHRIGIHATANLTDLERFTVPSRHAAAGPRHSRSVHQPRLHGSRSNGATPRHSAVAPSTRGVAKPTNSDTGRHGGRRSSDTSKGPA